MDYGEMGMVEEQSTASTLERGRPGDMAEVTGGKEG